jgi:hypothetical protein
MQEWDSKQLGLMVYKFKLSVFHFDIGLRFQDIMKSAVYLQLSPLHRGPEVTYINKVHGLVYFCILN